MADQPEAPSVSPVELAQAEVFGWLLQHRYLTAEGVAAVRGMLTGPGHESLQSRAVLVLTIRRLARMGGWPPSDDPAWPPADDELWDAVPLPDVPDDLGDLGGGHTDRW